MFKLVEGSANEISMVLENSELLPISTLVGNSEETSSVEEL